MILLLLMLVAGFAPYMTYKAISFMGFDMYHAMSAEQEAKSALNRPMPIPMSRRPMAEPAQVLGGGLGVGSERHENQQDGKQAGKGGHGR